MGAPISIREAYEGRHVLVAGGSGFLGKVWLAMVLQRIPNVGRISLLLRGKGRGVKERFEKLVNEGHVFAPLHEQLGERLSDYVSQRLEVVAGDVSRPDLGMEPQVAERLRGSVDLIINFAGLVDFNPDLRDAADTNVMGAVHVADFVRSCAKAKLVHVSTCYVAGQRDGRIPEEVQPLAPSGEPIDASEELAYMRRIIERTELDNESPDVEAHLHKDVIKRLEDRKGGANERRIRDMVGRLKRKRLRETMAAAGTDRAKELGWPNTYTYTKALAEYLLLDRLAPEQFAIFRPAIVESAVEYPFAGWNEGFNTSGPLVYLAKTWFRHIPAREGNPLDVIPVDMVCKALLIAGAAVMRGEHAPVYQCGSSDRNFLPIDRLTELSALGHRRWLKEHGESALHKVILSRWDALAADPDHVLNLGNIRSVLGQLTRYLRNGLPEKIPSELQEAADRLATETESSNRRLRQIEDVLALFQPFTHDHYCVFICRAVDRHPVIEPELRFEPESIEWRGYWLQVHMPGLRRWCFPTFENKDREVYQPVVPFELREALPPGAGSEAVELEKETG
ncbi:SDR family oxidoreductase [Paraliomyxa miuraensis]|uniref:SDR family oxidoreductase n=1 Tax=Paraliomyxa miuraensis TaxID=376150 RepID=UPI0022512D0B|nr:SDR family oxidoreductase [Paraliomyxa miuraensis]MCX4246117.1 SDR family oxidoreductase [Paraliomyxa miuraensis]